MTRTYRDPQLLAFQAAVIGSLSLLAVTTGVLFWPSRGAVICLVLTPVLLVLAARASRQGVRTDKDGVTVRDQWNRVRHMPWQEIERFEIVRGEGRRAHTAFARLRDGTTVELAPLAGAEIQSASHRRRWAEQSVDALNAQLEQVRDSAPAR